MRLAKLVVKLEMIKREGVELVLIDCLREDRLQPRMGWGLLVSPLYLWTFQVLGKPGEGPEGSGHWDPLLSEISSSLCGRVSVGVEWISGETKSASQRQQAPSCCEKIDGAVISLCGSHFDMEKAGEGVGVESAVVGCGTDVISDEMIRSLFLPMLV